MKNERAQGLAKAGIARATKHLFVCLGPDCCHSAEGEKLWAHIKARVKESGVPVMRTKAACFRICTDGPWLVIYPDGIWYPRVTPKRFDRILQEHILGGRCVEEWVAARNDLRPPLADRSE